MIPDDAIRRICRSVPVSGFNLRNSDYTLRYIEISVPDENLRVIVERMQRLEAAISRENLHITKCVMVEATSSSWFRVQYFVSL